MNNTLKFKTNHFAVPTCTTLSIDDLQLYFIEGGKEVDRLWLLNSAFPEPHDILFIVEIVGYETASIYDLNEMINAYIENFECWALTASDLRR